MPISGSAKKSLRKSIKNRGVNRRLKDRLKEALKEFWTKSGAKTTEVQSMIDKATKKGIIHKNKAARLKSQISRKVKPEVKTVKKKTNKEM